jgi:hypothetical protein
MENARLITETHEALARIIHQDVALAGDGGRRGVFFGGARDAINRV